MITVEEIYNYVQLMYERLSAKLNNEHSKEYVQFDYMLGKLDAFTQLLDWIKVKTEDDK